MLKRDRRELELIMLDLRRAADYLAKQDVAVCRVGGQVTTTLHMTRKMDGKIFYEVNKEVGSNLCGLQEGMRKLERMLNPEPVDIEF